MIISSDVFADGGQIPVKYTCDGDGINPPLMFDEVPSEAKSLALIVSDPDAPSGNFIHWVIWNINPQMTKIASASVPTGAVEGINSSGKVGYTPPCPPNGTHHYLFRAIALDTNIKPEKGETLENFEAAIINHILAESIFTGLYSRQ